jgi:SWI/SNF-related matrix-associated actin-dependent regulator 1 of chromatin subfamily A
MAELPSVTRRIIKVDLTNANEYRFARDEFMAWLQEVDPASVRSSLMAEGLVRMAKLRQLSGLGKLEYAKQYINELTDSGEKVVVFTAHRETLRQLADNKWLYIDGGVAKETRAHYINTFQNSAEPQAIIVNLKAGGTGITLTAAAVCVFVELDWSPANMLQAEDRICRIGQKAEHVEAVYLIGKNTIDNTLVKALQEKTKAIERVVSGSCLEGLSKEEEPQQKLLKMFMHKMNKG